MRLIDADELMKAMYHRAFETDGDTMWQSGCWVRYRAIEQVVKEQPTIERKTGKWILTEDDDYEYCTCSECGYQNGENWMIGSDIPFCAMCGADMRGDDHETD